MNVAIIGSSGFIGQNLFRYLYDNTDYKLILIDRVNKKYSKKEKDSGRLSIFNKNILFGNDISLTLRNNDLWPDIIVNLASTSCVDESICEPGKVMQNNVNLMVSVLHATKELKIPLLHISSDEQYGPKQIDEQFDGRYNPSNPYAASKVAQEMMINAYRNTYGIHASCLTLTNQFGPYQTFNKFTPIVIKNIYDGKPVPLHCDNHSISKGYRIWRYVGNTVKQIHTIIKHPTLWGLNTYLNGVLMDNLQYIDLISQLIGKPFALNRLNGAVARPGHDIGYKLSNSDTSYKITEMIQDMKTTIKHYTS